MLRFSGFELDPQRAELRGPDGGTIKLRPKTLEMLRLFAGNAGRVLSKQELMEAVWPNVHVGEDSLFQCIREIRTALGDDKRQMVRLISGRGYLFEAEVTERRAGRAASGRDRQAAPAALGRTAAAGRTVNPPNGLSTSACAAAQPSLLPPGARHPGLAHRRLDAAPRLHLRTRADDHRGDADRRRQQRSARRPDGR